MKKVRRKLILLITTLLTCGAMSMNAMASELEADTGAVVTADGNIMSGTLGDNNGISWSYDVGNKILTVTGEDSISECYIQELGGFGSPFYDICKDVKKIVIRDCKLIGDASRLFYSLSSLENIEFIDFDTSDITNMSYMFAHCKYLDSPDVSDFNTTNVTNMHGMFYNCWDIDSLNVSNFNTANVTDMSFMFFYCKRIESLDVSNFDTTNVTNMAYMFSDCWKLESLNVSNFNTSKVTDMQYMFASNRLSNIDVSNFDTSNVTNMGGMFSHHGGSETILDLSNFDTSNVTNMASMFLGCQIVSLDLSNFDTSNVTNMDSMFYACNKLTELDISNFDTSKVTDMSRIFMKTPLTNLNLNHFDTSNVRHMDGMFGLCDKLTKLDISNFDTSKANNMYYMFKGCSNLEELDVSGFDTSNVEDMYEMFRGCSKLKILNVSNFNTSKVIYMDYMFYECSNLEELNLSKFDISKVDNVDNMLKGCTNLTLIHTPNKLSETQTITLPDTFYDLNNSTVTQITEDDCDLMLVKDMWKKGNRTISIVTDVSEVTIDDSLQLVLNVNDMKQSTKTNSKYYLWSIDSSDVISVSDSGLVTGIGMGTATVKCINKVDSSEVASIKITIRIPFSDIKTTDWQYPYVVYAYENKLMSGKGGGKFDMNGKLTRSEFVTVLYSYTGKPAITYEQYFSDVKSSDWFANAVVWAKQNGVAAGNANGTFGVYNNITREQLVVMLYQYAIKNGVAEAGAVTGDLSSYSDLDKVSIWAVNALTWAVENNIITGKNRGEVRILDPKGSTTRGECATMMMRYVELVKSSK